MDHDSWERELLEDEDVSRHIRAGSFIPVHIGGDGAFGLLVRVGAQGRPAELSRREAGHLVVSSSPYLFVSTGLACLSGIEDVSAEPDDAVLGVPVEPGEHAVTVHMIDW
ncbi:hypothetical protein ACGF07_03710 [Kitasatospora sp. NPDC048194]|uniref:hypothetical protein n=1 Tax=Kitasatospora sp. NPDC048194 TaxID=3364045 RepID=UPI003711DD42